MLTTDERNAAGSGLNTGSPIEPFWAARGLVKTAAWKRLARTDAFPQATSGKLSPWMGKQYGS